VVQCSDNQGSRLDPGDLVVIDPKYQASLLLNPAGAIHSSPCSFYNKRAFYPLLSSHIIFPPNILTHASPVRSHGSHEHLSTSHKLHIPIPPHPASFNLPCLRHTSRRRRSVHSDAVRTLLRSLGLADLHIMHSVQSPSACNSSQGSSKISRCKSSGVAELAGVFDWERRRTGLELEAGGVEFGSGDMGCKMYVPRPSS
jgi:hypothetical protein